MSASSSPQYSASALRSQQAPARTVSSTKTMPIRFVLERLQSEFDDVSLSKIRYLESQGLITPQRTSSGYRRFTEDDVERLRYILRAQRDEYLPLKVIREQLAAIDSGAVRTLASTGVGQPAHPARPARLTDHDLCKLSGASAGTLQDLLDIELIVPDRSGFFASNDVEVVKLAIKLKEMGVSNRLLRSLRLAADRQAEVIETATLPLTQSKNEDAHQQAADEAHQLSAVVASLNAKLLGSKLRRQRRS